jgi:hypothetical protein
MLSLLAQLSKINPTLARRIVVFSFLIQSIAERPLRVLARLRRRQPTIALDAYEELFGMYMDRGQEIAQLRAENVALKRRILAGLRLYVGKGTQV